MFEAFIALLRKEYEQYLAAQLHYHLVRGRDFSEFAERLAFGIRTRPWGYINTYGVPFTHEDVAQAWAIAGYHEERARRYAKKLHAPVPTAIEIPRGSYAPSL